MPVAVFALKTLNRSIVPSIEPYGPLNLLLNFRFIVLKSGLFKDPRSPIRIVIVLELGMLRNTYVRSPLVPALICIKVANCISQGNVATPLSVEPQVQVLSRLYTS